MSNASAKYVLSAEDKTKSAVASVKRGFENLDRSAKKLSQGLKAFGIGAVGAKAFGKAAALANEGIKNLAASNAEFAAQVKVGEAAMRSALTAGEDTIKAQERLNAALTDPQMQAATRNLTDNLGAFFTGVKATAIEAFGWLTKLETKIGLTRRDFAGEYAAAVQMARAGIEMPTVDKDPDKYMRLVRAATLRDQKEAAKDAAQALADAQKANADFAEGMRDAMDGAYRDLERGYDEEAKRHLEYFIEPVIANLDLIPEATKAISDEMSIYADQAARNMQDAFADFLFDPFDKGLKGMLKNFVDVMRRITAETAAAKIFDSKSKGGLGLADWLSGALDGLFGDAIVPPGPKVLPGGALTPFSGPRAAGGPVDAGRSYLVGERGPELFTPGRSGTITPNGAGKSVVIHSAPTINVNAAQLTQDQAARMVADSQRMMWDELDRRYGLA